MKMEPIVSFETSAIRTQTPGNYPKRNNLHLEHGESLRTRNIGFDNMRRKSWQTEWLSATLPSNYGKVAVISIGMQAAQGQCIFVIPENIALECFSVFHSSGLRLSALMPCSLNEMYSAVHVRAYRVDTFRVEGNLFYVEQGCLNRGSYILTVKKIIWRWFSWPWGWPDTAFLKVFPNEGDLVINRN